MSTVMLYSLHFYSDIYPLFLIKIKNQTKNKNIILVASIC